MADLSEYSFPTRVDLWLAAVVTVSLLGGLVAIVLSARQNPSEALVAGGIYVATTALILVIAVPTRYTITATELVIRSGVLRTRVPLESIRRVYPTHNPLAAPAWSLNRLGIEYFRGRVQSLALISPGRQDEFLVLLGERAGLAPDGRGLRRKDPAAG